jgi:hypothetical protein
MGDSEVNIHTAIASFLVGWGLCDEWQHQYVTAAMYLCTAAIIFVFSPKEIVK